MGKIGSAKSALARGGVHSMAKTPENFHNMLIKLKKKTMIFNIMPKFGSTTTYVLKRLNYCINGDGLANMPYLVKSLY